MAQVKIIAPQTREAEHLRVAAYCRVSSDSKDQLHSYAAQIRNYTEEIAQHDGWELVDVYADEGLTGTRMDQRAAKKLAYDFGIDPDKPPAAMALKKPYPLARAFRNDEIHCQRVLCDYLHLLERWKVEYAPQSPEDELDDRFVEACHMIEYVNDLLDVLMFAELKQRVKAVDMLLKDGTITALEQRLRRLEKEVQHRGEERAIA